MGDLLLDELIIQKSYTCVELKVIVMLKKRLIFSNRILRFTQKEVATEIKSTQANVSKALKKFETDGIIYKDGLDYYFSDEFIAENKTTQSRAKKA